MINYLIRKIKRNNTVNYLLIQLNNYIMVNTSYGLPKDR